MSVYRPVTGRFVGRVLGEQPGQAPDLRPSRRRCPVGRSSPPHTPTKDWIRTELTAIARELELDDVRAVATTLANTALWDPAMDTRRAQFAQLLTDQLTTGLDEAQARGELTLHVDSRSAAAVTRPLYFRSTIEHAPIDGDLIDTVIATLGHWT